MKLSSNVVSNDGSASLWKYFAKKNKSIDKPTDFDRWVCIKKHLTKLTNNMLVVNLFNSLNIKI